MLAPTQLDPRTVYDDAALRLALGLTSATLARARRRKELRYARKGRQILYLGQWILDWLTQTAFRQPDDKLGEAGGEGSL
jgi:hypothetical protein